MHCSRNPCSAVGAAALDACRACECALTKQDLLSVGGDRRQAEPRSRICTKLDLFALQAFPDGGHSIQGFTFAEWVNAIEDWLRDNYRWLTRGIAEALIGGAR